jgi:hypothetical protein
VASSAAIFARWIGAETGMGSKREGFFAAVIFNSLKMARSRKIDASKFGSVY